MQELAVDPAAKQQTIDMAYKLAHEYEQMYGSCPQCVLAAIQDALEIGDDVLVKASHGLAGGIGLTTRGTCGALSGGLLALGARYGRSREDFGKGRFIESYTAAKKLVDRFLAEFGSLICADVQTKVLGRSFDMWDPRDVKAFEEAGARKDKRPGVAGLVAKWAAEMLLEPEEVQQKRRIRL